MGDSLLTRKAPIKVALESAKGTEVAGTQAIIVFDPDMKPDGEFERRMGSGVFLGSNLAGVIVGRSGTLTMNVELRSDGAGGMEPGLAILLQGCGLAKTAEVYEVHSSISDQKTISIDLYQDGRLKTLFGASGTFTVEAESGGRVMLSFTFTGIYKTPADIALPAFAPSTTPPLQFQNGIFTVGGSALATSKFSLDMGNVIAPKADVTGPGGVLFYEIRDYDPSVGFDPESDLVANHDIYGIWLAGTLAALILTLGDSTTNITIGCPAIQYKEIPDADRDGVRVHETNAQCNHTVAGNDSVSFTAAAA